MKSDSPLRAAALCMILAPLFALASALIAPKLDNGDNLAQLDTIAHASTRWYWFTLLLLIGSMLLVPAVLGLAALVRQHSPRLGMIGGALALLGSLIAIGDVMTQFVSWQMVSGGANRVQMAALLKRYNDAAGVSVVFSVGGLAVLVGVLLLSAGLIRGRIAPVWAAAGISVATVVNVVAFSASSNVAVAISWLLLAASMGYVGRAVLVRKSPRLATQALQTG